MRIQKREGITRVEPKVNHGEPRRGVGGVVGLPIGSDGEAGAGARDNNQARRIAKELILLAF